MKEDQQGYSIGIDVGGSHISGAIIDLRSYELLPDSWVTREMDPGQEKKKHSSKLGAGTEPATDQSGGQGSKRHRLCHARSF